MSLVGSLEDLGLADILQIVSLARKSGVLVLRSEDGEGRIVFREGLVHAALVKGQPEDLETLLGGAGRSGAEPPARERIEAMRRELLRGPRSRGGFVALDATTPVPMGATCMPSLAAQVPLAGSCTHCHTKPDQLLGPLEHGAARLSIERDPARAAGAVIETKTQSAAFAQLLALWQADGRR